MPRQQTLTIYRFLSLTRFVLALTFALAGSSALQAGNQTWTGGGANSNWSTTGNWNSGAGPAAGASDIAVFSGLESTVGSSPNITTSLSTTELNFSTTTTSGYNVSASPSQTLTLSGTTAINAANTAGTNTISAPLILSGGTAFSQASGGTLIISGNISTGSQLTVQGGGAVSISGNVTQTGGAGLQISTGSTSLTLSGNNSFSGGITLNNSLESLSIGSGGSATSLGTGTITFGAGYGYSLTNNSGSALTFANTTLLSIGRNNGPVNLVTFGGSNLTFNGNVSVYNQPSGSTITVNNGLTLNGVISNGNSADTFNVGGTGTLTLGGASTISGGIGDNSGATITVTASTVTTTGGITNGPVGTGTVTLNGGSTFEDNSGSGGNITLANALSLNGTVTLTSADAGSLTFGPQTLTTANTATLTAATTLTVNNTTTIADAISGAYSLTKSGNGTLILSGANTYAGATSVSSGTLSISSLNKVSGGSASSNLGAPTTVANGTIALGSSTMTGTLIYTGLGESTDRVVNLAGTTGGGTIENDGSGAITFSSNLTATGAGSKTLTLQGSNTGANTISGAIVDNTGGNKTSVTKSGSGAWALAGTNTYTGKTTVSTGTLEFSAPASLYNSTTASWAAANITTSSGATLAFGVGASGFSASQIGTLNTNLITNSTSTTGFLGGSSIGLDTQGATFTPTNGFANPAGGGALGLTKLGTGSLALSSSSTYSGGTTISAGTLYANTTGAVGSGNSATGTGPVNVNVGTFFSGKGIITPTGTDDVTVSSDGTLAPGENSVAGSGVAAPDGVQGIIPYGGTASTSANGNLTLDPTGFTGGGPGTPTGSLGSYTALVTLNSSNLIFALGASNSSSKLIIGGSVNNVVNFTGSSNSVVTINDLVGSQLTLSQEYVLIQGNGDTTFSGLTLGAFTGLGYEITGGLALLAANTPGNFFSDWYTSSELFLNGDNIDIEVIPEPSTWAMVLGGFALLLLRQRRKI